MRLSTLWLAILLNACGPCHHERVASLSNADVVVSGRSGGGIVEHPAPTVGNPLGLGLPPASRCIPALTLLARLGPACNHESENAIAPAAGPAPELDDGKPLPGREVRWYCDGKMDVRIVFEPCATNGDGKLDGVTPVEIALTTHSH